MKRTDWLFYGHLLPLHKEAEPGYEPKKYRSTITYWFHETQIHSTVRSIPRIMGYSHRG